MRNNVLIVYMKEIKVSRNKGKIMRNYVIRNHSVISKEHINSQK